MKRYILVENQGRLCIIYDVTTCKQLIIPINMSSRYLEEEMTKDQKDKWAGYEMPEGSEK